MEAGEEPDDVGDGLIRGRHELEHPSPPPSPAGAIVGHGRPFSRSLDPAGEPEDVQWLPR